MGNKNKNGPAPYPNSVKKPCPGGAGAPSAASKRKAEGLQPLMETNPLASWSSYKKFMVISSTDPNKKAINQSPFKIHKELVRILGVEPHGVTKERSGDIMVELRSELQHLKLGKVTEFLGMPVTVEAHKSLNSSKGVIRHRDFRPCSEEEIVEELPGVIHARRIKVRKGADRVPTDTIVLTFDTPRPPTSLRAGYLTLPVRPYIPFPMRCFKCQRFGHGKDRCRRPNAVCARCGKGDHDEQQCSAPHFCINCRGDHPAFSKNCPKFLEEQAILRFKAEHGGTFQEARAAVVVEKPKEISTRLFSQVVKTSLKSNKQAPPKASGKAPSSATPMGKNAQKDTPTSSPKGAVSNMSTRSRASRSSSGQDAPRESFGRFGNQSDMDVDDLDAILSHPASSAKSAEECPLPSSPLSQSPPPSSPSRDRSSSPLRSRPPSSPSQPQTGADSQPAPTGADSQPASSPPPYPLTANVVVVKGLPGRNK